MKALYFSCLLIFTSVLFAQQPGTLDESFGRDGRAWDTLGIYANWQNMLVQPDNKIIAGGTGFLKGSGIKTFRIDRALKDGRPDPTFGDSGRVLIEFHFSNNEENHNSSVTCMALQPDGKIVAGGYYSNHSGFNQKFVVVRLLNNGVIDSSFGVNGFASPDINYTIISGKAMQVQADGRILVGGTYEKIINDEVFFLFRMLPDGSMDKGFGKKGFIIENYGRVNALALQPDGKIVAGGTNGFYFESPAFLIRRYLTDGTPDKRFGKNGSVDTLFRSGGDYLADLALQPDGKILITGNGSNLYRFNSNGIIDSKFGINGTAVSPFPNKIFTISTYSRKVLVSGNSIYVLGQGSIYVSNNTSDLFLIAYHTNGNIDSAFAINGLQTANYGFKDYAGSAALQSDGNIIVLGLTGDQRESYQLRNLLRYYGYPPQNSLKEKSKMVALKTAVISFILSPNPARDFVIVNGLSATDKATIIINDALGKMISVYNTSGASQYKCDVSKLIAGVYYLQIRTHSKTEVTKFIKE